MPLLICLAIALHDVDGPIRCQSGEKIRLQGIGALETDGSCKTAQPCVPGNPFDQRRTMARVMGARVSHEDMAKGATPALYGQLWFNPVRLECTLTGKSHNRLTAWCKLPDGRDLSCAAISAGIAVRWVRYDPRGRLSRCTVGATVTAK
jgi:hypothetical protein